MSRNLDSSNQSTASPSPHLCLLDHCSVFLEQGHALGGAKVIPSWIYRSPVGCFKRIQWFLPFLWDLSANDSSGLKMTIQLGGISGKNFLFLIINSCYCRSSTSHKSSFFPSSRSPTIDNHWQTINQRISSITDHHYSWLHPHDSVANQCLETILDPSSIINLLVNNHH